jgi:hypothetical protein
VSQPKTLPTTILVDSHHKMTFRNPVPPKGQDFSTFVKTVSQ